MDLPELPTHLGAEKYFNDILPARFAEMKDSLPTRFLGLTMAVTVEIIGARGGAWTIRLDSGRLKVEKGETPDRLVKLMIRGDDWMGAIMGDRGFGHSQNSASRNSITKYMESMTPEKVERIKSIQGALKLVILESGKPNWEIAVVLGPETPRDYNCVVSINGSDVAAIREGSMDPQNAFMSGKISISGDQPFAMRLGIVLNNMGPEECR